MEGAREHIIATFGQHKIEMALQASWSLLGAFLAQCVPPVLARAADTQAADFYAGTSLPWLAQRDRTRLAISWTTFSSARLLVPLSVGPWMSLSVESTCHTREGTALGVALE